MIDLAKLKLFLGALVVAVLALTFWRSEVRREALAEQTISTLEGRVKQLSKTADSLAAEFRKADTVFQRDTLRLTKLSHITDTLNVQVLQRLTDTMFVKQVIAADDSTIKVCLLTVHDCGVARKFAEDGWANARLQLSAKDSLITAYKALKPSILSRVGLSIGYGAVASPAGVQAGFGALLGLRIWP